MDKNLFIKTRRIYIKQDINLGDSIQQDMHYIKNVIRLKNQEKIRIFNEKQEFLCILQDNKLIPIQLIRTNEVRTNVKISIAISILKQNAMHDAISAIAQFDIFKIYPLITERTQVREFNYNKYNSIIQSSIEQSEKMNLIEISNVIKLTDLLKIDNANIICCDEAFYYKDLENCEFNNMHINNFNGMKNSNTNFDYINNNANFNDISNNINSNINLNSINSNNIYAKINQLDKAKEIIIIVGPEGGFTNNEHELIAKIFPTYLTFSTILKSEIAAIASISIVSAILR
ncbi:MAG: RsmE family RNA methyltransferase [Rickettsiales bacterium]